MRFLLVDHNDSFTWNVYHLMKEAGMQDITLAQPHQMSLSQVLSFDHFVLSPGPGRPEEYPWTIEMIKCLNKGQCLFGICLGMQALCLAKGGTLAAMNQLQHGVQISITVDTSHPLFQSLKQRIKVGKYHSWIPEIETLPQSLQCIGRDDEGHMMSVAATDQPLWGVQFHPESLMTLDGLSMMRAFLQLCRSMSHSPH